MQARITSCASQASTRQLPSTSSRTEWLIEAALFALVVIPLLKDMVTSRYGAWSCVDNISHFSFEWVGF